MGIEIEAAMVRCVPVVEGCIIEPQPATPRQSKDVASPVSPALARVSPKNIPAVVRPAVSSGVGTKTRTAYVRPVNPKLVTAAEVEKANQAAAARTDTARIDPTKPAQATSTAAPVHPAATAPAAPLAPPYYSIPPAAMLPRFAGEPLRADLRWPPQARGTGEVWPPEARIEAGETCGRFPMGYAWHMLTAQQPWTWNTEGRAIRVNAAEAIAQVLSTAGKQHDAQAGTSTDGASPCALVIPNHLSDAGQQQLLDAAATQRINLSLLPRPIAAAMAWCDQYAGELTVDRSEPDRAIGSIAVLHFGLDMWEVTTVDILARRVDGQVRFIPARRRRPIAPLPSYGLELMHRLAIRSLEMSYQQMGAARVWELLWCTPWLASALSLLSDGEAAFPSVVSLAKHARSAEFLKQQCRQATQRIFRAGEPIPGLLRQCLGATPQFTEIRDWFQQRKLDAPAEGFLGAVITGPLANVPCEKESVGLHHLLKMWAKPVRVMIEGVTTPVGVLARSAGWHADFLRRRSQGDAQAAALPTYLESLPRVRIAGMVQGQPTWVDLLEDMPPLVAGGVPVRRPQPLAGFPIKADTTKFKVAIHHEDRPTIHIAAAPLPQVLSQAEPVTLHATLRPSHGFPIIELVPMHEGLFGKQRVVVDMRTMKDTGKSPDEFLKSVRGE